MNVVTFQIKEFGFSSCNLIILVIQFIFTQSYPLLKVHIGLIGWIVIFAVACFCSALFGYYRLPETRGKSHEEIMQNLDKWMLFVIQFRLEHSEPFVSTKFLFLTSRYKTIDSHSAYQNSLNVKTRAQTTSCCVCLSFHFVVVIPQNSVVRWSCATQIAICISVLCVSYSCRYQSIIAISIQILILMSKTIVGLCIEFQFI